MNNNIKYKNYLKSKLFFLILIVIFLLFLKIDFRITNDLVCCGDDYDYFSHSKTIVYDFDFDYSNQLPNKSRFYDNEKNAPIGFIGSGLLAAPFLFLGRLLDVIFRNQFENFQNFSYLIYSFSSIFYMFLSLNLIKKVLYSYQINLNYVLYFFGSGIMYYAFERYSMTHVYEVFSLMLLIYLTLKLIETKSNRNKYLIFIPLAQLLVVLVRWTNFYLILIPIFIILSKDIELKKFFNVKDTLLYFFSFLFSFMLFIIHTIKVYGKVTFSPSYIYMTGKFDNYFYSNEVSYYLFLIKKLFNDMITILFSNEFGIFWTSPIMFIGFISTVINILFLKNKKLKILSLYFLSCYLFNFLVVSTWGSTAASYGYRYLYVLIPISLLSYGFLTKYKNTLILSKYLFLFSIFSIISVLFFEASEFTQLSTVEVLNSFGNIRPYSQPNYVTGVIKSLFIFESYLKIIATSFLGIVIFKILFLIFGFDIIYNLFIKLSINNQDLNNLLLKLNNIGIEYFLISILFTLLICKYFINRVLKNM